MPRQDATLQLLDYFVDADGTNTEALYFYFVQNNTIYCIRLVTVIANLPHDWHTLLPPISRTRHHSSSTSYSPFLQIVVVTFAERVPFLIGTLITERSLFDKFIYTLKETKEPNWRESLPCSYHYSIALNRRGSKEHCYHNRHTFCWSFPQSRTSRFWTLLLVYLGLKYIDCTTKNNFWEGLSKQNLYKNSSYIYNRPAWQFLFLFLSLTLCFSTSITMLCLALAHWI